MNDFLYDYQIDAVKRMKDGCILNGEPGVGKSRTALYYIFKEYGGSIDGDRVVRMKNPPDIYIITTAFKRDKLEWEEEFIPFGITTHEENKIYDHVVKVDSWNNIGKYKEITGAFFIFDEDRVTGSGPWVKAFYKITKNNRWIILSATPADRWKDYIPVFVANGFYRNKTDFLEQHAVWDRFAKFPKIVSYRSEGRLIKYRAMITVKMKKRKNKPNYHVEDLYLPYDKDKYREVMKYRKNPFKGYEPIVNAAELCFCLRQIVNTDWSRIECVEDIVAEKKRVIIFYNLVIEANLLRAYHYGDDVVVAEWNGQRHEPVPTSEKWVYLVQYTAGCEGWNCTTCDTIIFFSQNYSYRVMKQASGRIDRANTPFKDLYYYYFKSRSSIDLSIERALKEKRKFNDSDFEVKI